MRAQGMPAPLVHNRDMGDDPKEPALSRQEFEEAAERKRRLEAWLEGMLAGGPPLAEVVKQWREGMAMYHAPEAEADEDGDSSVGKPRPLEETLSEARRRIRERREEAGKPPFEIDDAERHRRSAEVTFAIEADRANGKEPTPLHLVLAARYIEGEINSDEYSLAIMHL
jgi:exonuclease VII small subunit